MSGASELVYAGFWRRFNAYGIDATLLFIVAYTIDTLFSSGNTAANANPANMQLLMDIAAAIESGVLTPELKALAIDSLKRSILGGSIIPGPSALLMGALSAFYNIGFIASKWCATPGKHWLGLKVTMQGGRKLTLLESAIRHTCSGLSIATLGLGYLTMFATRQKLALHDMICNTRVIRVSQIPIEP